MLLVLSFPASSHSRRHSSIGNAICRARSLSDVDSILHALHIRNFHLAHINRSLCRRLAYALGLLPASAALGMILLVRGKIERDEKKKI